MSTWCVYLISNAGRYYTGITTDLSNRLFQHGIEKALYVANGLTRDQAVKRERELKRWSLRKKETLINEQTRK